MTKIYVVTDTKKGIIGSYRSEEQALKAIEQYEKDFGRAPIPIASTLRIS